MSLIPGLAAALAIALPQDAHLPAVWTEPIEPFAIADDLYYVGSADLASYLFTSEEGHILIDAPLAENVDLVLRNIRKLGFDPSEIEIQLASHAHFDHVGGLAGMLKATQARLLLSRADAALVQAGGGPREAGGGYASVRADGRIEHLDVVEVGGQALIAHLTPGHTRGCTSWSGQARIDGEPLMFVSICSLTVLPGTRLVDPDPTYPGIATDFCRSVHHLRALHPDIFLGPHGSFIGLREKAAAVAEGDRRAFVDPERYTRYLDRAEDRLERALAEQGYEGGCNRVLAEAEAPESGQMGPASPPDPSGSAETVPCTPDRRCAGSRFPPH